MLIDTARRIADEKALNAQELHHAHREGDLLHAVTFVVMKTTSHSDNFTTSQVAKDQFTLVAFHRRNGKMGDVFVRKNGHPVDLLSQIAKAGAEDDAKIGFKICF